MKDTTESSKWRNRKKQIIRWNAYCLVRDGVPDVLADITKQAERQVARERKQQAMSAVNKAATRKPRKKLPKVT